MDALRIAVVADIHGNLAALDAVIEDIAAASPDLVVNCGDCVSGPIEPAGTAERLLGLGWPTVRGNHDRYLVTLEPEAMKATDRVAYDRLAQRHFDWLETLPMTMEVAPGVLMFHATPADDRPYLTDAVAEERIVLAAPEAVAEAIAGVAGELFLFGHSHVPRQVRLPAGALLVNPGSVGLQAYHDEHPVPHRVEVGSPHARYAIVEGRAGLWRVEQRAVPYDWEHSARLADELGRPDWAYALRTGYAAPA
ncbi:metallophosphoesterase family protein [Prosthecomicrobium pneumaticum]|uniref:Putative phosphodiesterase n=1 Tax=Prosthecomicrobium pneumaticum TaxID=81895 RepID=A0A7W9FKR8_9HYPH|nr:metallophosphoesterase family protein [Prosthecomicrobium pneumaticum]MBB5751393.1 putative phosphodiesterase [Prosthecomicrobium pneumaticum]